MRLPDAVHAALGAEPPKPPPPLQVVCLKCAKVTDLPEPKVKPAEGEVLERLMKLRDEFARASGTGRFASGRSRYVDSASREWRLLPVRWREDLLTLAGLGADIPALQALALRDWYEIPPPARVHISGLVRSAKRHLCGLTALAARV